MNFDTFFDKLTELEKGIAINSPVAKSVRAVYWGVPPGAVVELPAIFNALAEPDRVLGFGSRNTRALKVNVQLLVAKVTPEDVRSARIATAFWFAARDAFDKDSTIGGTVGLSILRGSDPTVPVLLNHAGQAYIGFDAFLYIRDVESFEF